MQLKNVMLKAIVLLVWGVQSVQAQNELPKLPPRTIQDVLAVLNKPTDEIESVKEAKHFLSLPEPKDADSEQLHTYYASKSEALARLGQVNKAMETLNEVVTKYPSKYIYLQMTDLSKLAGYEVELGELHRAMKLLLQVRELIPRGGMVLSYYINNSGALARIYSELGDFETAEKYIRDVESTNVALRRSPNFAGAGEWWSANTGLVKSRYLTTQGKWLESEVLLRQTVSSMSNWIQKIKADPKSKLNAPLSADPMDGRFVIGNFMTPRIGAQLLLAKALSMQGKLIEAELQVREALDLSIEYYGKDSLQTGKALLEFSQILMQQNRLNEAVVLAKKSLDVFDQTGASSSSLAVLGAKRYLAKYLVEEGKYAQADQLFSEIASAIEKGDQMTQSIPSGDVDWAISKIKINQPKAAHQMTQALLGNFKKQSNPSEKKLASVEVIGAYALHELGQDNEAHAQFKRFMPTLMSSLEIDAENQTGGSREHERLKIAIEGNIATLATLAKNKPSEAAALGAEAFTLADVARGSGVQKALTASAARANIKDPHLSQLARSEQDIQQQINSLEYILTRLLASPPEDQLPVVQEKMKNDIRRLKAERTAIRKEIEIKFPEYAQLVNPKPATVEKVKAQLKADEVLVSWYFGDKESFVWAIDKSKPVQFHKIQMSRAQMASVVARLRKALDPGVATVDDIPVFDVELAHDFYKTTLAPLEAELQGKRVMIAVPHAEQAQLPLSLLVTRHAKVAIKSKGGDFSEYRQVAWLAKELAVTQLPSVTSLASLRSLPTPRTDRRPFIGFGDPYFSLDQAKLAEAKAIAQSVKSVAMRGVPLSLRSVPKTSEVSSAELALLPRLPDTKEEIEQIGKALSADPQQDLFLERAASVSKVLETDLSNRKVVMFATHGLVPGELNGLTQPALALSAPDVTGEKQGDGLLTMEKILTLKLDADWVVLSACNTASGEGAGSEAVSGLGRAFFYAGARALLVSNWPVDSEASRLLMTDLFKRQQSNAGQQKAVYLQAAMMDMLQNNQAKDASGKVKYTYAHPLFWAPFVVVGD